MKHSYSNSWGSPISQTLLEHPPDAGAGAGGGGAAGAASSGSGGAAGDGSGSGGSAPVKLSADTMVDLGDGKPTRWGELTDAEKGRFMPRDRYDRGVQYLTAEAARLQKHFYSLSQQQQQNRGRG